MARKERRAINKRAVVIGGSNGIGLAIAKLLMEKGYFIEICDRVPPEEGILNTGSFQYTYCDLLYLDEAMFAALASNPEVKLLMITAGIGRIADFRAHHIAEIEKILRIDAVSTIKIIRLFYERLLLKQTFYTGVLCSISGWMSSPAASVYAAAKAALVRFLESVNIELEVAGTDNRILDVSPASFKGTRFYGGENDLAAITPLAEEILDHLFLRETCFIPQYEEIYKSVIERYRDDPHEYGLHSYRYKMASGRMDNERKIRTGYLSGTFDLFHVGHLNLLRRAKAYCDYLIVGVHESGRWKGKETFIPFEDRKAIVGACKYVDKVVDSRLEDSDAWELWHYDLLFVGSDYYGTERFMRYEMFFRDKGVEIIYLPYTQSISSTQIRNRIRLNCGSTDDLPDAWNWENKRK